MLMNESSSLSASHSISQALRLIGLAYLAALVVGVLVVAIAPGSVLLRALWADIAATLVIFGFSHVYRNASFYDAYWSVAPPFLALYFFLVHAGQLDLRGVVVFALVLAWAIRLTHNWARGWQGLDHVDWRYIDLKNGSGRWWWLVNLFGIHLFPTFMVFAGCISLQVIFNHSGHGFGAWDLIATAIGWAALWLEFRADNQLHEFKQQAQPGDLLRTGVWRWCRHPNYTGEIGFWVALYVYACAASGSAHAAYSWLGPLTMIVLFVFISIPMIDKRMARNRPSYAEHMATSFALLPISQWVWPKSHPSAD